MWENKCAPNKRNTPGSEPWRRTGFDGRAVLTRQGSLKVGKMIIAYQQHVTSRSQEYHQFKHPTFHRRVSVPRPEKIFQRAL
jgi:hypothetical protein